MKTRLFALLPALIPLCVGCGGDLQKKEMFAAYGEDGAPMYYRITLKASGYNGDLQYRAGWFDADAVDDLFGDLATRASIQADLVNKQREAVTSTLGAYLDALKANDTSDDTIARRKNAFDQSLSVITGITPAGAPKTAAIDYAGKKFVIILSNKPDEIVAAVKGQVQKRELLNAVGVALQAKTQIDVKGGLQTQVLRARLAALAESVKTAEDQLPAQPTNGDVSSLLNKIQAEAEALP